jgi:molybdopterin-guanine dinucleotide biosynthesis protein A
MGGVAGAVLVGGASRRMGRTKALVRVDGVPMAARVAAALQAGGCAPVALVGGSAGELAVLGHGVVDDVHPGSGPVGGVITALGHFATSTHVLVTACDLPMLDAPTVRRLLSVSHRYPDCAAVVAHTDRPEPGVVVWNRAALDVIVTMFDQGERALYRVLAQLDQKLVQVEPAALLNVNRPGDVPNSGKTCQ